MEVLKKIFLIVLVFVFVLGAAYTIFYYTYYKRVLACRKQWQSIAVDEIDLTKIKNGIYEGEVDADFIQAKVKVNVSNGIISEINLVEHKHGSNHSGKEMLNRILKKQSLKVDTITSATGSSMIILKATEQALKKGLK